MKSLNGVAVVAAWTALAIAGAALAQEADCDHDGIPDADEIAGGAADLDGNGIPDTCECITDLDGNGEVNGADIAVLLSLWGEVPAPAPPADINRDGLVDGVDLGILLGGWGPCDQELDFDLVFMSTQNLDPKDSPPPFNATHATVLLGPVPVADPSALRIYTWAHTNDTAQVQYAYYGHRHVDGDTAYLPSFWYLKNEENPVFPASAISLGTLELEGEQYRVWMLFAGNSAAPGESIAMGAQ